MESRVKQFKFNETHITVFVNGMVTEKSHPVLVSVILQSTHVTRHLLQWKFSEH